MEVYLIAFFAIALLYSMVGHGGASAYLALMALLAFSPVMLRPTALILNLLVSFIAFAAFAHQGHFRWKIFWPFAVASIPMAWLGGTVTLPERYFKIALALFLLVAVYRLVFRMNASVNKAELNIPRALVIGAVLGFVSGIIGIGGGIILSPVIMLLGWANAKTTAATSALFIFVNSAAGLAGIGAEIELHPQLGYMLLAVLLGSLLGGWLGSSKYSVKRVQQVLAVLLLAAAVKLLVLP